MIIFAFMYAYILYTVYHLQQNHGRGKKGLSHSDKPFFLVGAPTWGARLRYHATGQKAPLIGELAAKGGLRGSLKRITLNYKETA